MKNRLKYILVVLFTIPILSCQEDFLERTPTDAISSADGTILSWSSIFTGNYPFKTGIRSERFGKLDKDIMTIFDYLKKFGYSFYSFIPSFSETIGLFPNFKNVVSIGV